jgi:hypothetical protein
MKKEINMNMTTEPFKITKREFFRRVVPIGNGKLDTFDVHPKEQHRLNIIKTTLVLPEGTTYSVGFVLDGVAYYLESESKFILNAVA